MPNAEPIPQPIELAPSDPQSDLAGYSLRRRIVAAAAAASISLGSGCTVGDAADEIPQTGSPEPYVSKYDTYFDLPYSACNTYPFQDDVETARKKAEECIAAQSGRIIFVNFGTDAAAVAVSADQTEALLPKITEGVLTPTIDTVEATPEATAAYVAASNGRECVDTAEPLEYASYAAETTMPETEDYDYVVAISGRSFCASAEAGVADHTRSRISDIEGLYPSGNTVPAEELLRRNIHEILHLYGVGHSGQVLSRLNSDFSSDIYGNDITLRTGSLDLNQYLAEDRASYEEYGDSGSVMGRATGESLEYSKLDVVNQFMLSRHTEIAQQLPPSQREADITPAGVTIAEAQSGAFVSVRLTEPILLPSRGLADREQYFSDLAFVPHVDGTGGNANIWAVEIGLVSIQNTFASLGPLSRDNIETGEFKVTAGKEIFTLSFAKDNIQVVKNRA